MKDIKLIQGDMLVEHEQIEDGSVDLILTDLPYGTTACAWDTIIPLDEMWDIFHRIIRPNGMIVLTASQPFTTKLIGSNINNFSHQWVWDKGIVPNPFLANKMPLKTFEDVLVFCQQHDHNGTHPLRPYFKQVLEFIGTTKKVITDKIGQKADHTFRVNSSQFVLCTEETYQELIDVFNIDKMQGFKEYKKLENPERVYNPQMVTRGKPVKKGFKGKTKGSSYLGSVEMDTTSYNNVYYPKAILKIQQKKTGNHPTQKPVELMEYMIKTYSNKGDTVVDLTMGSGSTGVACANTNRKFVGIELNEGYFKIAEDRINNLQTTLL